MSRSTGRKTKLWHHLSLMLSASRM
ncbi:rCG58781 [Rattus norvegicus]|uniref:RCG58781 n=1 Tax=Rattus norvegicus TaxID=10116 RepID=A6JLF4_RAT|nr:rCG58781 [Rattus norvegicus]